MSQWIYALIYPVFCFVFFYIWDKIVILVTYCGKLYSLITGYMLNQAVLLLELGSQAFIGELKSLHWKARCTTDSYLSPYYYTQIS